MVNNAKGVSLCYAGDVWFSILCLPEPLQLNGYGNQLVLFVGSKLCK